MELHSTQKSTTPLYLQQQTRESFTRRENVVPVYAQAHERASELHKAAIYSTEAPEIWMIGKKLKFQLSIIFLLKGPKIESRPFPQQQQHVYFYRASKPPSLSTALFAKVMARNIMLVTQI
jgi:hypothetical protein